MAQDTGTITGRVENTVSGDALNLAKVKVQGTNLEVFTNEFGEYRLTGLPAGEVTLLVSYTGLVSRTIAVDVMAGGTVAKDVSLTTQRMTTAMRGDDTVVMDAFTVASERDTNAASIAANEQRYSGNLKNVVASDAFGDVTEGNIGEFMKFLPGISVDYVAADVRTMAVRGFADNFTSISVNGARMASSASGAASRSFEFEQVSINNVARIEVSKAPTPSMPADSLGGAVNMVSKSAFERKGAQLKYKVYVSANSEALDLIKKTPGPMNKPTAKVLPGFDFDYTLPVSDTFGIVVTGLVSNQYNEQHRSQKVWSFGQAGATPTNPYLQQYLFQDGPKNTYRRSGSVKADWKLAPGSVLSASLQSNYYLSQFGNRNYTYNVGTSASSTPSGGAALSYGPDFTHGADGRGSVRGQTSFRDKYGATTAGNLNWNYKADVWEIDASVNASKSRTWYRDTGRGHFSEVRSSLLGAKRVDFDGINDAGISNVTIFDAAGNVMDPTLYSNYRVEYGRGNPIDAYDKFVGGNVNFKYNLDLSFPAAIKLGADRRVQTRDIRKWDESWQLAGTVTGAAYTDLSFSFQDPGFGLRPQQYPDAYALYSLLQNDSAKYAQTTAQALAAERFRRQNSQRLKETISAGYLQAEAKLMDGHLGLITGVRYEKTEDEGVGPLTKGPI
ncbi:MAG: TonB-dependent receptor, partial [Cephaloticoccus sp.]|nr:TonB-dependent receptor [Cephaloticoccus sp.]